MPTILIVDDEPALASAIARYLRQSGFEVESVSGGREALRLLESTAFDLVITDINMPEVDGIEVLGRIRELDPDLPVIAMSGGGLVDKRLLLSTATALGAVRTLPKPFGLDELESAVRALLDG